MSMNGKISLSTLLVLSPLSNSIGKILAQMSNYIEARWEALKSRLRKKYLLGKKQTSYYIYFVIILVYILVYYIPLQQGTL